jgi:hypothetical protein
MRALSFANLAASKVTPSGGEVSPSFPNAKRGGAATEAKAVSTCIPTQKLHGECPACHETGALPSGTGDCVGSVRLTSPASENSSPLFAPSKTMQLIDKLVEGLPHFPLGAPLPILGTADQYAARPCSNPKPRYMPKGTCHCGFQLGEHAKGGAK